MKFNIKDDSRKITKGDIFVAIKGISSDGHDYIEQAIENGAIKIIAEHGSYSVETIIVENTKEYLEKYLEDNYKKYLNSMTIVGFTGTNGKTTSAFLLYQALNELKIKCAYIGTVGFYLDKKVCSIPNTTVELCTMYEYMIQAYNEGYKFIALECSSHGLAMGRLNTISFDYAIFSNLTHDHLDFHLDMENYAMAKRKLFENLKPSGKAIINFDDKYCDFFSLKENINITYGFNGGDYKVTDYSFDIDGSTFIYEHNNIKTKINYKLLGQYNISNLLPIMIILEEIGVNDLNSIISKLKEPPGRMDMIKYKSNTIIVDYAHTPDGFEKIITTVNQVTKGKTYVIFGVRGNRDRTKRPEMMRIANTLADYVIITQNHIFAEDPNQIIDDLVKGAINDEYCICFDRKDAIIQGINMLKENDTLMILGKGHEDYLDIGGSRIPFDDKEVVLDYIEKIKES